ncbi:DUF3037 domain-containing protein [Eggerthellaceae bacterium 24-137]
MAEVIEFSVLGYYPSIVTDENINVGILFHNIDRNERYFYVTKNWKRLEGFDDELDVEFMKEYLSGMRGEIECTLFNLEAQFSVRDYIRFYVNELRFGEVRSASVDDASAFIEATKKICMRFDFDKKERISKVSEVSYLKRLLRQDGISFDARPVRGSFEENVKFDLRINDYCFKFFTFEDKELKYMMNSVKAWAFTADSLRDSYKTIFVVDVDRLDSKEFEILKRILKRSGRVLTSVEAIDFVCSISSPTV